MLVVGARLLLALAAPLLISFPLSHVCPNEATRPMQVESVGRLSAVHAKTLEQSDVWLPEYPMAPGGQPMGWTPPWEPNRPTAPLRQRELAGPKAPMGLAPLGQRRARWHARGPSAAAAVAESPRQETGDGKDESDGGYPRSMLVHMDWAWAWDTFLVLHSSLVIWRSRPALRARPPCACCSIHEQQRAPPAEGTEVSGGLG